MIRWELLDSAQVPGSNGALCLYKRGRELSIMVNGSELMNSRAHGSEEALADLACSHISTVVRPHILIGGLGMGFTTAAALRRISGESHVIVAELVPAVVEWNKGPLAHLAGYPLEDARVIVKNTDVAHLIRKERGAYDVILLDVDNGPEGLTRRNNDWLYSRAGLDAAFSALRPAGVLAVWSAGPDRNFAERLRLAGFEVHEHVVRSRGPGKGDRHTIWVAKRSS